MTAEPTYGPLTMEELQLATRNRGMPLEALAYDITPSGLHYLLVHFDIPVIDAEKWHMEIGGAVGKPSLLTLNQIRDRPARTIPVTLECAGNGRASLQPRPVSNPWILEAIGTAEWTGISVASLLEEAGLDPGAVEIVFTGADHGIQGELEQDYARSLSVTDATNPDVMLAYEMNGRPLEPQHGYPLRLVVPGWYGMASVKWLTRIEAVTQPFDGYQMSGSYRYSRDADDPGDPVTRMRVRSLMIPPGFPDFPARQRTLPAGPTTIRGRAWGGTAAITQVEFAIDGSWSDAQLDAPIGDHAWRAWSYEWEADPGEHVLACRATDASGDVQPDEPRWNFGGYANNSVHQVPVTVIASRR